MARKLRLEYPGAIYHVINRGNYRSWIFETEGAKAAFEEALFEACDRAGWILHAYAIMGNHYHLALETPQPNLSEGMRWLGSVFALRFNRFRKEKGSLFQDRFKSIAVEGGDQLAWLCHYVNLNPVRAGICDVRGLRDYRWCGMRFLRRRRARPSFLSFEACLEGAGNLADGSRGWSKYEQYLSWLSEDEPRKKEMNFERMSKGWALGSKGFKTALLEDGKRLAAAIELGDCDAKEARELAWAVALGEAFKILGKGPKDASEGMKSEDWKVAIAGFLKKRMLCRNGWIAERLGMGTVSGVSRYVSQMLEGERPQAKALYEILMTRIKH